MKTETENGEHNIPEKQPEVILPAETVKQVSLEPGMEWKSEERWMMMIEK